MSTTLVAIFLILHGLAHAIVALAPSPGAPEKGVATFFSGMGSRLPTRLGLSESTSRVIATVLSVFAAIGFLASGLALFGMLVPFEWWRTLAIASAVVSLGLVVIFWNRYAIASLLINVAILVALVFANWSPV
jgi:hypothetical protein